VVVGVVVVVGGIVVVVGGTVVLVVGGAEVVVGAGVVQLAGSSSSTVRFCAPFSSAWRRSGSVSAGSA
jgi:hypothetical protein